MHLRPTGRLGLPKSARPHASSLLHSTTSLFESLEWRRLLARSVSPCACGQCTMCGNPSALSRPVESPVVFDLPTASRSLSQTALTRTFSALDSLTRPSDMAENVIQPASYTPFTIDLDQLKFELQNVPALDASSPGDGAIVAIPSPTGSFERFEIYESSVMHPDLAVSAPYIKTFVGIGVDDPTARLAMDYTSLGFHAAVLGEGDDWYIDPYWHRDDSQYVSYFKSDLYSPNTEGWICQLEHDHALDEITHATAESADADYTLPSLTLFGTQLRTFDFVVAATGEYTTYQGGAANALSAITTVTSRLNEVFKRDLASQLVLVANQASLIFPSAATDPFTSASSASTTNSQAQAQFDSLVGSANYDVGHVFHRGSNNGLAGGIGTVGTNGVKGQGYSSYSAPTGDPFTIDYVAHELGHQFGGRHSFSSAGGGPGDSNSLAVEPGSGSTIMSYAGIGDTGENMQAHSDAMFHSINIDQITTFLNGSTRGATITTTGNTIPTIAALTNHVIPARTPFALTANAADADGDTLTYSWEQRNGNSGTLATPSATQTTGPAFRAKLPVSSPTRVFPQLSTILTGGTSTVGETLPSVARTMTFYVLVRDNNVLGGGMRMLNRNVTTVNTGTVPFGFSNYNTASTVAGGSSLALTWNVAGTTANGINTANVKISLSLNNGQTFPNVLSESTANDGAETITLPYDTGASQARLKIEAVGNIFFDINNAAINLQLVPTPVSQTPSAPLLLSDTGVSTSDGLTNRNNASPTSVLEVQVDNTVNGALVELLLDGVVVGSATAAGTSTLITTDGTTVFADGDHTLTARQTETGKPVSPVSGFDSIRIDSVAPTFASTPAFAFETGHSLSYAFTESIFNFDSAALTISDGSNTTAATVAYDDGPFSAAVTFGGLLGNGNYTATINGTVTDGAGNSLADLTPLSFFVLAGDINRDRIVNFDDLLLLAQNYGSAGKTFSTGNLSYDEAGNVDFDDLLILAQAYGTSLPALTSARSLASAGGSKRRGVAADLI